jgi:hypothetical protein
LNDKPPPFLYFGPDKRKRAKLLPLPYEAIIYNGHGKYHQWYGAGDCEDCMFYKDSATSYGQTIACGYKVPEYYSPYSIRSVISQLGMDEVISCHYFSSDGITDKWGNVIREEGCMESCPGCTYKYSIHDCTVVSGRTKGTDSCSGLQFLMNQCQSDIERTFLDLYLRFNKDRESPMPIPQCWTDPLDRHRSDFVVIANSKERNQFEWFSVEMDSRRHHPTGNVSDTDKDHEVRKNGFPPYRIRAEGEGSILNGVREFLEILQDL